MKRYCWIVLLMLFSSSHAQDIKERLDAAVKAFVADSQLKHAIVGFYVADANTGELIYDLNSKVGLAPASTQKIVTSVAAFELLGIDHKYKTQLGYSGQSEKESLKGDLFIKGSGDPTFGSFRYESTKPEVVFAKLADHLKKFRIKRITGNIYIDASSFTYQPLPGGWIWDDIGNYYGAGNFGVNWRENQYDLLLKPGKKEGDKIQITGTVPEIAGLKLTNNLITGKKGSGDNAYIYYPPYATAGFVEGSFEGKALISGAIPDPPKQFAFELQQLLKKNNIKVDGKFITSRELIDQHKIIPVAKDIFFEHYSPSLDSIIYWFMQKSINLYGEVLMKTVALKISGVGSLDSGIAIVKRFYKDKEIVAPAEMIIMDGSGLSPSNRITAEAFAKILLYAKKQAWFPAFRQSFPEYNNMQLKSGTINGTKSFAGYHTSANGKEYVVTFIVNNYSGAIVSKMFKVLDELK
jgi:D-alanyl-D-alanine carboxypeptidase/D-alanyl-D-alanine-endopeptidase (penicillin-binding protein 4)